MSNIFKPIPGHAKYEIAFNGTIRFCSNKRSVALDKKGETAVLNDDGEKVIINRKTILAEVWKNPTAGKADAEKPAEVAGETKKKKPTAEKPAAAAADSPKSNGELEKAKAKIAALTCKKYQRIYLLSTLGIDKKEIATIVGANAGEVYNALKTVSANPEKAKVADALIA